MATDFDLLIKGKQKVSSEILNRPTSAYPAFFKFENPGDWIEGVLSEPREIEQDGGRTSKVMTITTTQGQTFSIGLTSRLDGLWNMTGKKVVIRFLKYDRTGSFFTKEFEVYEV